MIRLLDLFSGVGGFSLAARMAGGYETIAFCEIEPFCRAVLAKHWPGVPIYEDITKIDPAELPEADIWTGGFPCQDISCAGKGAGLHGARSGMFFEIVRLLHGVRRRPDWLLLENVPAILSRGLDRVLDELAGAGYACWPVVVGAWAVGAPQKRDRVWIVGRLGNRKSGDGRLLLQPGRSQQASPEPIGAGEGGLVDAERRGRREAGRRRAECDSQPAGHYDGATTQESSPLADPQLDAGREQEPGRRPQGGTAAGGAGEGGELADAYFQRTSQQESTESAKPRQDSRPDNGRGGGGLRWPSRPGQPQFDWEAPRLSQFNVGGFLDGLPAGLVQFVARSRGCSDSEAEAWYRRNKVKIDRAMNKLALKAMGNSIVSQCAAIILQWIKNCERTTNERP